jgi:hypothetical protein
MKYERKGEIPAYFRSMLSLRIIIVREANKDSRIERSDGVNKRVRRKKYSQKREVDGIEVIGL